jgi:HD-like signal output (HDOD) protein
LRQVYELVDAIDYRNKALLVEVRCENLVNDARPLAKKDAKVFTDLLTKFTEVMYKTSSHHVLKLKNKLFAGEFVVYA